MKRNSVYDEAQRFERTLITSQNTEYMRGFSFWPSPDKREGKNIYDVRSYQLKPGNDQERGRANPVVTIDFRSNETIDLYV